MRKIIWSEDAENDFSDNIDYLLKEWSVKDAEEFISKVDKIVFSLRHNRINYKLSSFENIRQCVVCKQITLYYREKSDNEIELVRFWNTYQDKRKLRF